jgi:hypothetical protein
MKTFEPISLDNHWQLNTERDSFSLSDWLLQHGMVELRRMFDLEPIGEVCLRFYLHVDAAPGGTAVSMNGHEVGTVQAGQSFAADVTDDLTLENNLLLLKVSQRGVFASVWLERIPCDNC